MHYGLALSMLAWSFAPSVIILLIILAPIALSGGILNTILSSALTKAVKTQEIGGILGLSSSIESLTRVIASTLGGLLPDQFGTWSPGVLSAIILMGLCVYNLRTIFNHQSVQLVSAK